MMKQLSLSVLAVSMGLLTGCGAAPDDVETTSNGVSVTRGQDGVVRRTSTGRDGYLADLAHFRQQLRDLQASPNPDRELISGVAGIVAHLEQLKIDRGPGAPSLSSLQTCGVSGYSLTPTVSLGVYWHSADAGSGYTEFGPPSPWSKTLYTYARAQAATGGGGSQTFTNTFSGAGTFSVPNAHAQVGTYGCKRLLAYASITANGCSGFDSLTEDFNDCD